MFFHNELQLLFLLIEKTLHKILSALFIFFLIKKRNKKIKTDNRKLPK